MIIKVCGMREGSNIREVEKLHPDMMGFMFWSGSKRYVAEKPEYLPKLYRVGVFVNPTLEDVVSKVKEYGLNRIQLHGTESAEFCHSVYKATGLLVTKAISIETEKDFETCSQYEQEQLQPTGKFIAGGHLNLDELYADTAHVYAEVALNDKHFCKENFTIRTMIAKPGKDNWAFIGCR